MGSSQELEAEAAPLDPHGEVVAVDRQFVRSSMPSPIRSYSAPMLSAILQKAYWKVDDTTSRMARDGADVMTNMDVIVPAPPVRASRS